MAFGPDSPLKKRLADTEQITLTHDQNEVAFDFVALHLANPAENGDVRCLGRLRLRRRGDPPACELADGSPEAAKEYFAHRLRERFPKTDIDVGRLAMRVRFSDAEVQLLPAMS